MDRLAVMPLVWLCTLFLVGIAASKSVPLPLWAWLAAAGIFLFFLFFEKRAAFRLFGRNRLLAFSPLPLSALLLTLCAGAAFFQANIPRPTPQDLAWYNGSRGVVVSGWVAEPPQDSDNFTTLRVEAQTIVVRTGEAARVVHGRMLVRTPAGSVYHYGDRMDLKGNLTAPPGGEGFSYRDYLAIHEVYSWLANPQISPTGQSAGSALLRGIFSLRDRLEANILRMLPPEEAGLLIGVLLGDDSGLSPSAQDAFRETGTTHLLAVSGFNISVLAALLGAGCKRIMPRSWSLLPVLAGLVIFSLMVGGQASVVRAAVMGCAAQVGLALGRRPTGGSGLLFSAALMSAFNPLILWDIGFQLSFAATLGILLWGDALTSASITLSERFLPPSLARKAGGWLAEFFLITLAAQVFTLPVTAYHFQTFSWIGLLANPLVLPVQEMLMFVGGLAALFSLIFLPLGQLFAWLAWPFGAYTLACVRLLANAGQGSWQTGDIPFIFVILYYLSLLAITAYGKRLLPVIQRAKWPAALLLTGLLALLTWRAYFSAPDGKLRLTRFDYPGETAYLLTSPSGSRVLISGMSQPGETSSFLGRELFPLPVRLDALILPVEKKADRNDLVRFASRIRFDRILILPSAGKTANLTEVTGFDTLEVIELQTGQRFDLGEDAELTVLRTAPGCADLALVYNRFSVWLPSCRLSEENDLPLQEWSAISLSGETLTKNDIRLLGRLSSSLVISSDSNPGLIAHPNWLTSGEGTAVLLVSDGISLEVSTSDQ